MANAQPTLTGRVVRAAAATSCGHGGLLQQLKLLVKMMAV
jgi:hypothetical protein